MKAPDGMLRRTWRWTIKAWSSERFRVFSLWAAQAVPVSVRSPDWWVVLAMRWEYFTLTRTPLAYSVCCAMQEAGRGNEAIRFYAAMAAYDDGQLLDCGDWSRMLLEANGHVVA